MGRCHFVQSTIVRLPLADVYRRALAELETKLAAKDPAVTHEDVAQARAALAEAEADGEWVDVKNELNAGEQRRVFGRLVKSMHFGEKAEVDPEQIGRTKLAEYLVGWSFRDADGAPVPFSEAALDNLKGKTYGAIVKAVDAHEAAVEAASVAVKNEKGDATK